MRPPQNSFVPLLCVGSPYMVIFKIWGADSLSLSHPRNATWTPRTRRGLGPPLPPLLLLLAAVSGHGSMYLEPKIGHHHHPLSGSPVRQLLRRWRASS